MWIPHFGFVLWERDHEGCAQSDQDKEPRLFDVRFQLENTDLRKIGDVPLSLARPIVVTQTNASGKEIQIRCEPNEEGRLRALIVRLTTSETREALRQAFNDVSHLLSFWSFMYGTNSSIFAIAVHDPKHDASWEARPQHASAEPLLFPTELGFDDHYRVILSLYREARNNSSPFYRFLCYFKILEAFYERREAFGAMDQILKAQSGKIRRPKRRVTKEMLAYALVSQDQLDAFRGKTFGSVYQYLNARYRAGIAHTYPTSTPWANLDDYDTFVQFNWLANLTDQIARQILLDELELWKQLPRHPS